MEFVDPPATRKGAVSEKWLAIAQALQENPNKWALVGDFTPGMATHLRRGTYPAFMGDFSGESPEQATLYMKLHWEITTRKIENSSEDEDQKPRHNIYMRWLG
jgi:hypothetical protein